MKRLGLAGLLLCVVVLVGKLFAHPALNNFVVVFADTDGGGLTGDFSGWVITNPADTDGQTFNLPPAAAGMHFIFALSAGEQIVVNPHDEDQFIGVAGTPATGEAIESDEVVGTLLEIVAIDSSKWLAIRRVGTWTQETP
jgi:hypothetical protein